jgi:hypothetical protein
MSADGRGMYLGVDDSLDDDLYPGTDWDLVAEQRAEDEHNRGDWDVECPCSCHGMSQSMICGTCCTTEEPF